jgi:uncharacterized membrane protein
MINTIFRSTAIMVPIILHLTWTALSNIPDKACNPLLIDSGYFTSTSSTESTLITVQTVISLIFIVVLVGGTSIAFSENNYLCEILTSATILSAMMTLTNWCHSSNGLVYYNGSMEAVWVKMASIWTALLIYCILLSCSKEINE